MIMFCEFSDALDPQYLRELDSRRETSLVIRFTLRRAIDTDKPPVYRWAQNRSETFDNSPTVWLENRAKRFDSVDDAHQWILSNGFRLLTHTIFSRWDLVNEKGEVVGGSHPPP